MRHLSIVFLTLAAVAACGDDKAGIRPPDAGSPADSPPDTSQVEPDGIGPAKGTGDGTGLTLKIVHATVTYIKPQVGNVTNDPAGFTIQAKKDGPGLFVSVDPATLNPVPVVGDVVDFTITTMGTVHDQRRAQAITGFTRVSQGADVSALATDISAATDVVSAVDTYDSRLVNVTGNALDAFASAGQGFQKATLSTAGIANDTNLQVRGTLTVIDAIDMVKDCKIAAKNVTVARFDAAAEIGVYAAGDVTLTNCPAPAIVTAVALSDTSLKLTFTRNIKGSSVTADGSQFTFDNGLTASAATVAGRTVTVTTSAQTVGTAYAITIANTLTDLQGTVLSTLSSNFSGFAPPAVVKINELNANIGGTDGCDLIELRVISAGSMTGFKITERNGGTGELNLTFPAGFNVQKNDFIVVHTAGPVAATCNPGGATAETVNKNDQPVATFGNNFDNAFDFWSADNGLTNTDNVITLFDATGAIIDAVFVSDNSAGTSTASATETAAAAVGAANQWQPALATYIDAVFRTNAADDLNATGTTQAGNSIQRKNDADTDSKDDWTTGSGVASTWGALNPGQAAL